MSGSVLVIAGRSGSGKSTLVRALASALGCERLGFSYAGRELASAEKESEEFRQIEEYVYNCILSALSRSELLILDGLASERVYDRLMREGFDVAVVFLDTPESLRIERIAEREGCSLETAAFVERSKAKGKAKSGLDYIIGKADTVIDGRQSAQAVLDQALLCCEAIVRRGK